jgi:hypothetical protein
MSRLSSLPGLDPAIHPAPPHFQRLHGCPGQAHGCPVERNRLSPTIHTQPKIPLAGLGPAINVFLGWRFRRPRRGCPEQVRARATYSCIAAHTVREIPRTPTAAADCQMVSRLWPAGAVSVFECEVAPGDWVKIRARLLAEWTRPKIHNPPEGPMTSPTFDAYERSGGRCHHKIRAIEGVWARAMTLVATREQMAVVASRPAMASFPDQPASLSRRI